MFAQFDAETRKRLEGYDKKRQDKKEAVDAKKAEQKRLTRNLGNVEGLYKKVHGCCVASTNRQGDIVYKLANGDLWDTFHGADYVDLYDADIDKSETAQFKAAVVTALKAIAYDSGGCADRRELAAFMDLLQDDFRFSTQSVQESKRVISGDYAVKRELQARYRTRTTVAS